MKKFVKFLKDWMLIIVFVLVVLSAATGYHDRTVFISLKWTLPIALFAMLFKPMVFLNLRKLFVKRTAEITKYLVIITILYIVVFPIVTFGLSKFWLAIMPNINPKLLAGIVLVSLAPVASSAPAFTSIAEGKAELTIIGVIWTFFMSIFVMPLYAKIFLHTVIAVPVGLLIKSLVIYIIIPLIVGQILRYSILRVKSEKSMKGTLETPLTGLSLLGLYWMVIVVFGINGRLIGKNPKLILTGIIVMNVYFVIRFLVAYITGRLAHLPLKNNISIVFSASTNMTISTAIAIGTFGPLAAMGCALGGPFSDMILLMLLSKFFARLSEKNK